MILFQLTTNAALRKDQATSTDQDTSTDVDAGIKVSTADVVEDAARNHGPTAADVEAALEGMFQVAGIKDTEHSGTAAGIAESRIEFGIGAKGEEIRALRRALNLIAEQDGASSSINILPDSDIFDESVDAAVRAFQARNELKVDGIVGEHTTLKLGEILNGVSITVAEQVNKMSGALASVNPKPATESVLAQVEKLRTLGTDWTSQSEQEEMVRIVKELVDSGKWEEAQQIYKGRIADLAERDFRSSPNNPMTAPDFVAKLRTTRANASEAADLAAYVRAQVDDIGDGDLLVSKLNSAIAKIDPAVASLAEELHAELGSASGGADRVSNFALKFGALQEKERVTLEQAYGTLYNEEIDVTSAIASRVERFVPLPEERKKIFGALGIPHDEEGFSLS